MRYHLLVNGNYFNDGDLLRILFFQSIRNTQLSDKMHYLPMITHHLPRDIFILKCLKIFFFFFAQNGLKILFSDSEAKIKMVIFGNFSEFLFQLLSLKITVHFKTNRIIPKKINFCLIWTKGSPLTPKNEYFFEINLGIIRFVSTRKKRI